MGLSRGVNPSGVFASKKAKYLGSFVTSDCDERVYLPAIVSGLNGSAARSQRVLVEVDEHELRVRPRPRLPFGAAAAEPSERASIDDLCVAHMCVTEPRLIVFVVRAASAPATLLSGTARRRRQQQQQQPPRYRVMVFLCKKPRHARQLLDVSSDAKFLADRVADKSVFVVGRQPMTRHESLPETVVEEGARPRRQLRPRYFSDSSLCGDNDGAVVEERVDYAGGGGDSYRAFDLDDEAVEELHPLPSSQQHSQQQTWQRRWRRQQQQQKHDGIVTSPSERGTMNRGTRSYSMWRTAQRGSGGDAETGADVAFATAQRTHATTAARRSRSVTDLTIASGGAAATASRGFSRQASSASTIRSSPPHVRQIATQPAESQWVYAKGESSATVAPRVGQTLSFGTSSRRVATAMSDGEVFEGSRTLGNRSASQRVAAAELGWRGRAGRSLSSFCPSSGSSDDDDASSSWTTGDVRATPVTLGRRAATLSSSPPPPSSSPPPALHHMTHADVYAVPRSGRQRQQQQQQQQQQKYHDATSSSYYYTSTLPDRASTARRQFA